MITVELLGQLALTLQMSYSFKLIPGMVIVALRLLCDASYSVDTACLKRRVSTSC